MQGAELDFTDIVVEVERNWREGCAGPVAMAFYAAFDMPAPSAHKRKRKRHDGSRKRTERLMGNRYGAADRHAKYQSALR